MTSGPVAEVPSPKSQWHERAGTPSLAAIACSLTASPVPAEAGAFSVTEGAAAGTDELMILINRTECGGCWLMLMLPDSMANGASSWRALRAWYEPPSARPRSVSLISCERGPSVQLKTASIDCRASSFRKYSLGSSACAERPVG